MKKFSLILCAALTLTGCAATAPRVSVMNTNPADALASGPAAGVPIQTLPVPEVQEKHRDRPEVLLSYRPSQNLPTFTDKGILLNTKSIKDLPLDVKIGTLPRLAVIPCDTGCVGNPDYEAAIKILLADYDKVVSARRGGFAYQGVLPLKVQAFNQRGYLQRTLPVVKGVGVGDLFAISLSIEGKKLTLSWENHSDERTTTENLASTAAATLSMMLMDAARGEKPQVIRTTLTALERNQGGINCQLNKTTSAMMSALGHRSTPSKLEPMSDQDRVLLPAFDGIHPNEINPITKPIELISAGC